MKDSPSQDVPIVPPDRSTVFPTVPEGGRIGLQAFRIWLPIIACAGTLIFWLGQFAGAVQKTENVVRADVVVGSRFDLTDRNGKSVASLHSKGAGMVSLSFYGENGAPKLDLGISPGDGPALKIYDTRGRPRLTLAIGAVDDVPRLQMASGVFGATLDIGVDDLGPQMSITRKSSAPHQGGQISVGLGSDGAPMLRLLGPGNNQPRISLGVNRFGPEITFAVTKDGVALPRLGLGLYSNGDPAIRLLGDAAQPRIRLGVSADRPTISLLAGKGLPKTVYTLGPDGTLAIDVEDAGGKRTCTLTVGRDGKPVVRGANQSQGQGGKAGK